MMHDDPNLKLRNLMMDTAKEIGVPLQTSTLEGGATDGQRSISTILCPYRCFAVPARHIILTVHYPSRRL